MADDIAKLREGRDLVSLLRDDEIGCCHECLCGEAADEIERLRAKIKEMGGCCESNDSINAPCFCLQRLDDEQKAPDVYLTQHHKGCKALFTKDPADCDCPHGNSGAWRR